MPKPEKEAALAATPAEEKEELAVVSKPAGQKNSLDRARQVSC